MTRKAKPPNGYVIYEGPSMLDGAPIAVIATGFAEDSLNTKTGAEIQTWILRSDMSPVQAVDTGADASICGSCVHRGRYDANTGKHGRGRSCYVKPFFAPASIWRAYKRGVYTRVDAVALAALLAGRVLRLGSYGDPAAAPYDLWEGAVAAASGHTGYTHAWRYCPPAFRRLVMASVDSPREAVEAMRAGWRTFRVRGGAEPLLTREVVCPASEEAGKKTQCEACRSCGGTTSKARAPIVIVAHGATNVIHAFNKLARD